MFNSAQGRNHWLWVKKLGDIEESKYKISIPVGNNGRSYEMRDNLRTRIRKSSTSLKVFQNCPTPSSAESLYEGKIVKMVRSCGVNNGPHNLDYNSNSLNLKCNCTYHLQYR